jgi:hypothetical protein
MYSTTEAVAWMVWPDLARAFGFTFVTGFSRGCQLTPWTCKTKDANIIWRLVKQSFSFGSRAPLLWVDVDAVLFFFSFLTEAR